MIQGGGVEPGVAGISGAIDAGDPVGGDAEHLFDVLAGGFGDSDDAGGAHQTAAHEGAVEFEAPVIGDVEEERTEVVDGDDVGTGEEDRDDIQGDVDKVGADAAGEGREGELVEGIRVGALVRKELEIVGQAVKLLLIAAATGEDETMGRAEPGESADEVADVGAKAEILDVAGIDEDPQRHRLYLFGDQAFTGSMRQR